MVFFVYGKKIEIHNRVLAKVNDKVISVIDLKNYMNFIFYKLYPNKEDILEKYKFYSSGWMDLLKEMINTEFIEQEFEKKKLKVENNEIQKRMKTLFAPDIMKTLEKLNLPYEIAKNLVKKDLIKEKLIGYFVHYKVLQKITPEVIKKHYLDFLKKNPEKTIWKYKIISANVEEEKKFFNNLHKICIEKENFEKLDLKKIEEQNQAKIKVSNYQISSYEISEKIKNILKNLKPKSFSTPILQKNRKTQKEAYKIFYLEDSEVKKPPSFNEMADKIKEKLFQKEYTKELHKYFYNLQKSYNFDENTILVSENFIPFSIK